MKKNSKISITEEKYQNNKQPNRSVLVSHLTFTLFFIFHYLHLNVKLKFHTLICKIYIFMCKSYILIFEFYPLIFKFYSFNCKIPHLCERKKVSI